jgi:uracil-DNA glycosylase
MPSADERREALKRIYIDEARDCVRCPLAQTRTNVVFGSGDADADLMFVGMERREVFITNILLCRPPNNRDPMPGEIEACEDYLSRKVELIEPRVICTLGNFATKLLRREPTGITRVHGRPEVRTIGGQAVRLYPLYHPAAALYTPAMLETLRGDFGRIPALLALPAAESPEPIPAPEPAVEEPRVAVATAAGDAPEQQLGLF